MGEGVLFLLRIIFTVLFAPVVYASGVNFYNHLDVYPPPHGEFFKWGMCAFLLVFLFLHRFDKMYQGGQSAMTEVFKFLTPLNHAIARTVPVYTLLLFVVFFIWGKLHDLSAYVHYFQFFAGFFFMMHIILLARELQDEESSFIKPSYLFQMSLYFVFSLCVMVLLLDLVVWQSTFPQFGGDVFRGARDIYLAAIEKIF
ncbi:MAG: hypothetical protein A2705_04855 [Omnitrophica WOR_2 bacterium RIFCSPHIGHO2_01_FULL_52_10]|nr:MAG: hypothetical protein A2705_04855 [Omnitrophica WOR_2 bacterium RIFCSPHIGHO2_01_FULL_52_10]